MSYLGTWWKIGKMLVCFTTIFTPLAQAAEVMGSPKMLPVTLVPNGLRSIVIIERGIRRGN